MIVLSLEAIGHDAPGLYAMPWVARLTGPDSQYGYVREFIRPAQTDYMAANSVGSRGVALVYHLERGVYEVAERISWSRWRRYFLVVDRGGREVGRAEVDAYFDRRPEYYVP